MIKHLEMTYMASSIDPKFCNTPFSLAPFPVQNVHAVPWRIIRLPEEYLCVFVEEAYFTMVSGHELHSRERIDTYEVWGYDLSRRPNHCQKSQQHINGPNPGHTGSNGEVLPRPLEGTRFLCQQFRLQK